jgi:glycosyltransferase involved in cell wall biosynthesis
MAVKQKSLSIFFPCYNDKGTIDSMVLKAKETAKTLTDDYEIIVIDDGSSDGSRDLLSNLRDKVPELRLVFHEKNIGYGGVLKTGFKTAAKDLIFYTDGDAQYDVKELPLLWEKMDHDVDVVNGYKLKRSDPLHRIVIGEVYKGVMRFVFQLPIRDPDCDFRLIRRYVFDKVVLTRDSGTVTIELVKKIQQAGFKFTQIGVHHYERVYGTSQFFSFKRVAETLWQLIFLWIKLIPGHKKKDR